VGLAGIQEECEAVDVALAKGLEIKETGKDDRNGKRSR
jgi:hypothetical protein